MQAAEKIPSIILSLAVSVEVYRVLSGDSEKLSITTLLNYVNRVESSRLSVTQLLDLFEIVSG